MRTYRASATFLSSSSWGRSFGLLSVASWGFASVACTGIVGVTDLPPATDESSSTSQSSNASSQGGSTTTSHGGSSSSTTRGSATLGSTTTASATSTTSGPACGASTSGGLSLSNNYQTVLGHGGYCYAYSDSSAGCSPCGTSTACSATTEAVLCASGVSAPTSASASNYGGGLGCNLNQAQAVNGVAPAAQSVAATGTGLAYTLDRAPPAGTNLVIDNAGTEYFCPISAISGSCTWSMFGTTPWNTTTNVTLTAAPGAATHIHVQVNSGAASLPWSLCIASLTFTGTTTTLAGVGDPCVYDSDCESDLCDATSSGDTGWCTVSCVYDSDCYGSYPGSLNAQGMSNFCVSTQGGNDYCFPGCVGSLDCPFTATSCISDGVDDVCSK